MQSSDTRSFDPVIKWTGSKRSQSKAITSMFPVGYARYFEPFVGGGSMLYASGARDAVASDICRPLIDLWNDIKYKPDALSQGYRARWEMLQRDAAAETYYAVRERFNKAIRDGGSADPSDFLFLTRTCMSGLVRFNSKGEFNVSFHAGRPGVHPDTMHKTLNEWSTRISGTVFLCDDFVSVLASATHDDLVYLDPPYLHTKGIYGSTVSLEQLCACLDDLNRRGIRWLMSYDGTSGDDDHTASIPKELYMRHIYIPSGVSSFKRIVCRKTEHVMESLYTNY